MAALQEQAQGSSQRPEQDELALEWHDLLGRYHRTTCALDRALLADHSITVSDFEVLEQLHAAGDRMRMHDLAEHVHLTQSALSRLISRLDNAGLVDRYTCEDDRRSVWTQITKSGQERYLAARPTHRAILQQQAVEGHSEDCNL